MEKLRRDLILIMLFTMVKVALLWCYKKVEGVLTVYCKICYAITGADYADSSRNWR